LYQRRTHPPNNSCPEGQEFNCDLRHTLSGLGAISARSGIYSAGVVALITDGTAYDRRGRPFKRRNYLPAIVVAVALFFATTVIWAIALTRPPTVREATACNPPPAPADPSQPTLGAQLSRTTMTEMAPAKLADAKVRVLNASGQGGQAADVAGSLRDLGFANPTAANDPIYAGTKLTCQGQLRFGRAGEAAAAAAWLVAPCVELFQDQRPDDTVDLALGTEFRTLTHTDDIDAMLASLRPEATAPPDLSLLSKIHTTAC
jgi:hypothetical protein